MEMDPGNSENPCSLTLQMVEAQGVVGWGWVPLDQWEADMCLLLIALLRKSCAML